jgi:GDPmannose 4,6-dehydratase
LSKRALIIGVTGQDGAYLARFLLRQGDEVFGTSRDALQARQNGLAILGIADRVHIFTVSPVDFASVTHALTRIAADEIYNLSGQSSVALSFDQPKETIDSIVSGTLNLLEALALKGHKVRFYNAGSSECFGETGAKPSNETTPFRPKSPYGIAKAAAVSLVAYYRERYGLFACSGLLFNHESPLRPLHFVTRKITAAAVRIAAGSEERLRLGNISIRRDWGWAPDYVETMWRMLQEDKPDDFVIGSGVSHTLEDFVTIAFGEVGLDWRKYVDHDPSLTRPSEIFESRADRSKATRSIGWTPKVSLREIIVRMIRGEREGAQAVS